MYVGNEPEEAAVAQNRGFGLLFKGFGIDSIDQGKILKILSSEMT